LSNAQSHHAVLAERLNIVFVAPNQHVTFSGADVRNVALAENTDNLRMNVEVWVTYPDNTLPPLRIERLFTWVPMQANFRD